MHPPFGGWPPLGGPITCTYSEYTVSLYFRISNKSVFIKPTKFIKSFHTQKTNTTIDSSTLDI